MTDDPLLLVKALLLLGVVLIAIYLLIWILKKLNTVTSTVAKHGEAPRLQVREAIQVDHKRRLVLVRRDHVEHLVLIGGENDLLVEHHILPQQPLHPAPGQPRQAAPRPAPQRPAGAPQASPRQQRAPAQSAPTAAPAKPDTALAPKQSEKDNGSPLGKAATSIAGAASGLTRFGRNGKPDPKNQEKTPENKVEPPERQSSDARATQKLEPILSEQPPHPLQSKPAAPDETPDGSVPESTESRTGPPPVPAAERVHPRDEEISPPPVEHPAGSDSQPRQDASEAPADAPGDDNKKAAEKTGASATSSYDDEINRLLNELSGDAQK